MRAAGFAVAVKNARAEVREEADYVTPHAGGDGAARDAVEFILKAQGKWRGASEGLRICEGSFESESFHGRISLFRSRQRTTKNPSDACLGRARVSIRWATVSPYSPCCFQEYLQ